ncbi:ATP-binding protein [Priestia flexa]|uniref:ATP-binding protein n=1 Tax=Priestia flexa TaxID=86664 RepID=UPI000C238D3E|nr:ATP-binding protein [Priestia flexa]MEC0666339.1 ATP-binding protein [Priestia flexa]
MKNITLQVLILKNFKGVKEFKLDTQGYNAQVFGDNGTGKTTLFDAFIWLLFDKDSQNKKDFQLKTVNAVGQEINNLEHEVEGIFSVDGTPLSIRKVFKEKWTRKRGAATTEFTGHTTDYFVNGVPSKKKEFTDAVATLIDEDVFKLLTSPLYFNEQLHWQKRRELLLQISGDITNEDVINSNKELASLENILNGKSIEDHRKIIAAKRTEINKELTRIPVRIDEVRRSVIDVSELNESAINEEIEKIQALITQQEEELSRIQNGTEVVEKQKKLREIESSLIELKNEYKEKNYGELNALRDKVAVQKDKNNQFNFDIKRKQHDLNIYEERLKASEKNIQHLREEWVKKDNETFDEHKTTCSMCGQEYPEDQKQEIIEKFNIEKSQQLEKIMNDGKLATKDVEQLKVDVSAIKNQLISLEAEKKESERVLSELKTQYGELKNNTTAFEETEELKTKQAEISSIQEEIQRVKDHANEEATLVREKIMNLKEDIRNLERDKAKFDQVEASNKRIEELEAEEKTLAKEFEELEHQLFLTEEFIRSKVTLLEEKINSKFKYARFQLFKQNINGGLEETCETLYQGVPYSRGLNNAARINVGLDIISTLSEHFGVTCPIFIDNSESVTELIDMDTQIISLVVSGADDELRVEQNQQLNQEAI